MSGTKTLIASALAAIGASACCVLPLILLSLGLGGAWVSHLTRLEPLRPFFIALTLGLLILAWRQLYRAPACLPAEVCASPRVSRNQKRLFWLLAPLMLVLIASPWIVAVMDV